MQVRTTGGKLILVGALIAMGAPFAPSTASAARTTEAGQKGAAPHASAVHATARAVQAGMWQAQRNALYRHAGRGRWAARHAWGGGLQCVPFARENSGIELVGNANTWWGNAEGIYERGGRPEVGSVLTFRATRHMPLGHVAVVTRIVDGRTIEIDHANWSGAGRVTREMSVVDVSEGNDWSAVRVELGQSGDYGNIYPTHGFIYDRPDRGAVVANTSFAPLPALNPPSRDHRAAHERQDAQQYDEVAEAPDDEAPRARRRPVRAYPHAVRVLRAGAGPAAARPAHTLLKPTFVSAKARVVQPARHHR